MKLEELPGMKNWLAQFSVPDVYVAEQMLSNMRFVSFEEVESWLQDSISTLLADIKSKEGKVAIAIFPVSKPFINKFNQDKDIKLPNDSAGRIAHSLKNIERNLPAYVELTPRLESMRKRKVKHIIFVDDFIGTGDRFIKSWRTTVSPSIKAWCSNGWCKIWLASYAAHKSGINRILHNIHALKQPNIRTNLLIERPFFLQSQAMRDVLKKYGDNLGSGKRIYGYGGLASPIVFQYGCPNNVPLIFWLRPEGKEKKRWAPLFPNRHIPSELYSLFDINLVKSAVAENFWDKKRYQLALTFLDNIKNYDKKRYQLLLMLTLLEQSNDLSQINNVMLITSKESMNLLKELFEGGAVDQHHKITNFGCEMLSRIAKGSQKGIVEREVTNFYPSTFLGFRRET
ncbi:hypothetical protein ACINJK_003286 [Cronobacter dublinensis]|uniref:phosphoribosyltransferase-like protein n=1 Tax=Cronobacter dublinensis TaxID=413497 RepID=UPI001375AB65|nr:hypothetical protein [Cronobacter dublinensis]